MQAEFNTTVNVSGTEDELKKIIEVFRQFEAKKFKGFLVDVQLKNEYRAAKLKDLIEKDALDAFVKESVGSIAIEAAGPWGSYQFVTDVKIFETMADVAPTASFSGKIEGGTSYTTENIDCEMKNGILHIESFYEGNEESSDKYVDFLTEKMPYDRFVELLEVDQDAFDEDEYEDYLSDSECYDSFMRDDFDEFQECCPVSRIGKKEYKTIKKHLSEEGLDWEAFIEDFEGGTTEEYNYDAVNHVYLK